MLPHFQQKLVVPIAPYPLISRPALHTRLEAAITTRRLVTLAAPAGWGKTTVLAQWAATTKLPVAWYTLDRTDHDLQLFVRYVLHAVAAYVPEASQVLGFVSQTAPHAISELLQRVAVAIAQAPQPFALVLDDAHILEEETDVSSFNQIFELLGTITEYAPNCHLVLASRTLPTRQGLARMVVQQRAAIFDYSALQFQPDEVQQLAQLAGYNALDTEQAKRLTSQLEGWIAGIVLALDHMAQHGNYDPSSNHILDLPLVYDYFAEQISAPLPPDLLRFLEDTSVLESLSPQRCDQLLGAGMSKPYFEILQYHTLFFSRRGNWLSLHSLFRDFLRSRLARDPERSRAMLRRAGDVYRNEDDLERAIEAYLAADAVDEATALLREVAARYLQHARQLTLLVCFEQLTEAYHRKDPTALLPADLLLLQARVFNDLAQWQRAELAAQLAMQSTDQRTQDQARIFAAEIYILQQKTNQAQHLLSQIDVERLEPDLQFTYQMTAGRLAMRLNDVEYAIIAFKQAQMLASSSVTTVSDVGALATIADNLGFAHILRGDRIQAIAALRQADAAWQACGNSGRRTMTLNNLGVLTMEEGQFAEAREALKTGRELAQITGRRREEMYLLESAADLAILEGELAEALTLFQQAMQLAIHVRVETLEGKVAIGALWCAVLLGEGSYEEYWQKAAAALKRSMPQEAHARFALSEGLNEVNKLYPNNDVLMYAVSKAANPTIMLSLPERATLELLRAHIALHEGGWKVAAPFWTAFESIAEQIADVVVAALVRPFKTLLKAAVSNSALARQYLVDETQIPAIRWMVLALGSFHCSIDGAPCSLSATHRALLVRLLDAGASGVSIERLQQDVWGDEVSIQKLHTTLSRFRAATKLTVTVHEGVCAIQSPLNEISYDVWNLERTLSLSPTIDTAQQAMAWYRGDFLPGEVPSATLWADARRAQLQQRYLDTIERIAQLVRHDAPEEALRLYQHVLQIDPCSEQTAVQVMQLAARSGRRSLVTTTFEHLSIALSSLGISPDPSVTELYSTLSRPTQPQTLAL